MFRASLIRPVKVYVFSDEITLLRAGRALSEGTKLRGMFKAVSMFYHKFGSTLANNRTCKI
jgi:hypothetical protein